MPPDTNRPLAPETEEQLSNALSLLVSGNSPAEIQTLIEARSVQDIISRVLLQALKSPDLQKQLAASMFRKALNGDTKMTSLIIGMIEGLPVQRSEIKMETTVNKTVWTPEQIMEARRRSAILKEVKNDQTT